MKYLTKSDKETIWLGGKLGALLEEGDVVALAGDLGSGKTWFSKGIALGLGIDKDTVVTSPSFSIVNEYKGRHTLFHMDLYRLDGLSDLISTGLGEYIYYGGVTVIEWADRFPEILPDSRIEIKFGIIDDNKREIHFKGGHPRAFDIIQSIRQEVVKDQAWH